MKRSLKWQLAALAVIIGAVVSTPDEAAADAVCPAGGPGATECSYDWSIPGGGGQSCSVTCGSGYYACCKPGSCKCVSGSGEEE